MRKLAIILGYGSLVECEVSNYFRGKGSNTWVLVIYTNVDGLVVEVQMNTNYNQPNDKVKALNEFATFKSPKTIEQCIEFIKTL